MLRAAVEFDQHAIDLRLFATVAAEQSRCDLARECGACIGHAAPVRIASFARFVGAGRSACRCYSTPNGITRAQFDFDGRPSTGIVYGTRRRT